MSSFPIFSLAMLCHLAETQILDIYLSLIEERGKTHAIPAVTGPRIKSAHAALI